MLCLPPAFSDHHCPVLRAGCECSLVPSVEPGALPACGHFSCAWCLSCVVETPQGYLWCRPPCQDECSEEGRKWDPCISPEETCMGTGWQ